MSICHDIQHFISLLKIMNQRTKFPVCVSSGDFFDRDEEKYQKHVKQYEWSADKSLQYVTAVIRNEMGDILVGFNKKHWARQIPSWKIDKGESHQAALKREMGEETDLVVQDTKYIGTSKVILNGIPWQWHFYDTKVKWNLQAKELDTMEIFKRVNFVEADTRLWFGITDGEKTITDPLEILKYWHMFTEIFRASNFPTYQPLTDQSISIPNDLDKEEIYIQYRDQDKNNLEIKKYKEFLEIIEI